MRSTSTRLSALSLLLALAVAGCDTVVSPEPGEPPPATLPLPETVDPDDIPSADARPPQASCALKASEQSYRPAWDRPDFWCEGRRYLYRSSYSNNVLAVWSTSDQKDVLFGWRGSFSAGDWLRDLQSQAFVNQWVSNPYCSGSSVKVGAGWADRIRYTKAGIIDWIDDNYATLQRITVVGHSLGGVSAQLSGHFLAQCYAGRTNGSAKARVNVVAFNPPRMSTDSGTLNQMRGVADGQQGGRSYNVRWQQFTRKGDIVHGLPTGMQHIKWDQWGTACIPTGEVARHRHVGPRILVPHDLGAWWDVIDSLGC